MEINTRVRYIHVDSEQDEESGYYPTVGTLGTVVKVGSAGILVKWDEGTKGDGEWWCEFSDVEEINLKERQVNDFAKLICEASQKTNYSCSDSLKTMCKGKGYCAYCLTIAEHIYNNMENK